MRVVGAFLLGIAKAGCHVVELEAPALAPELPEISYPMQ